MEVVGCFVYRPDTRVVLASLVNQKSSLVVPREASFFALCSSALLDSPIIPRGEPCTVDTAQPSPSPKRHGSDFYQAVKQTMSLGTESPSSTVAEIPWESLSAIGVPPRDVFFVAAAVPFDPPISSGEHGPLWVGVVSTRPVAGGLREAERDSLVVRSVLYAGRFELQVELIPTTTEMSYPANVRHLMEVFVNQLTIDEEEGVRQEEMCGLFHEENRIPLVSVQVEVEILDFIAKVNLRHTYVNHGATHPIECIFFFPLSDKSTICKFFVVVGGNTINGVLEEKGKAENVYSDAISSGHSAFLIEYISEDLFKASIGNLAPKEEVVVNITYLCELAFSPPEEPSTSSVCDYIVTMAVTIQNSTPITGLSCPNLSDTKISKHINGCTATLTARLSPGDLAHDFTLLIAQDNVTTPRILIERDTVNVNSLAVMITLQPSIVTSTVNSEIIFIVDQSGSMLNTIYYVSRALIHFLSILPPECMFNIIGFGTTWGSLFPNSVFATSENLVAAKRHVHSLAASLGGTNILEPLKHALGSAPIENYSRQIILFTDGAVDNTQEVCECVRQNCGDSRVFAFGLGAGVSRSLVRGIAYAGHGQAEFIARSSDIESSVEAQLSRALESAHTQVSVRWDGDHPLWTAPAHIPALFNNSKVVLYGVFAKSLPLSGTATVSARGTNTSKPIECMINFGESTPLTSCIIHALAAKERICDLEFQGESAKEQVIAISKQYSILSKYTSFVCISKRTSAVTTSMQTHHIPVAKPTSTAITGCVCWRAASIVYKKNELLLDFNEHVIVQISPANIAKCSEVCGNVVATSRLSYFPEVKMALAGGELGTAFLSESNSTHQCVRWRNVVPGAPVFNFEFTPPDGKFELMTYHLTPPPTHPLPVNASLVWQPVNRFTIKIKAHITTGTCSALSTATNKPTPKGITLVLTVPGCISVPCKSRHSDGTVALDAGNQCVHWILKSAAWNHSYSSEFTVDIAEEIHSLPPAEVNFTISQWLFTGVHVQQIDVIGKGLEKVTKMARIWYQMTATEVPRPKLDEETFNKVCDFVECETDEECRDFLQKNPYLIQQPVVQALFERAFVTFPTHPREFPRRFLRNGQMLKWMLDLQAATGGQQDITLFFHRLMSPDPSFRTWFESQVDDLMAALERKHKTPKQTTQCATHRS
ncbi:Adaptor complexes medium subunit family [Pelomyxa schiedti]|nr:Adaptor complexes medium subunit family [Pelomyxa schiedti]